MDADIRSEFVAVHGRLDKMDGRFDMVDDRLDKVDGRLDGLDRRIGEVDVRLSGEIRQLERSLRQEIREEGLATRRHFDVVAESLRDDIRIIAEGLIALDAKVESMRR